MKSKGPEKSEEIRKQFDREMAELDQIRQIAQQKLEKLKISSQKAWRDLKPGMDAAIKDLNAACKRAASEFD